MKITTIRAKVTRSFAPEDPKGKLRFQPMSADAEIVADLEPNDNYHECMEKIRQAALEAVEETLRAGWLRQANIPVTFPYTK